jgi:translation elongation factor EF-Ts
MNTLLLPRPNITAAEVKQYREKVGCGMMQARKELLGDYIKIRKEKLLDYTRKAQSIEELKSVILVILGDRDE